VRNNTSDTKTNAAQLSTKVAPRPPKTRQNARQKPTLPPVSWPRRTRQIPVGADFWPVDKQRWLVCAERSAALRQASLCAEQTRRVVADQGVGEKVYQRSRPVERTIEQQEAVHLILRVDVLDRNTRIHELTYVGDGSVS
jgi:hypothetical protein